MTTHAPMARQPFGELNNARLQQLASAKNRLNGIIASNTLSDKPVVSTGKRSFASSIVNDDAENVDPELFKSPSKKSKNQSFETPVKPFTFSLAPINTMPPPSIQSARSNIAPSPRAPMTAPSGRSPKRKTLGITKSRRTSAPFTRIDPPFASRTSSALPFSLDAALSGTLGPKASATAVQPSIPSKWRFDIYEDTPEDEASNLMEHSTLTLDLSSDEESSRKEREGRGKENTPPEGYDAPAASTPTPVSEPGEAGVGAAAPKLVKKTDLIRKKLNVDEMDDGQRSPLSDLETDPFFPEGLDKDSHVVLDVDQEKSTTPASKDAVAAPVQSKANKSSPLANTTVIEPPSEPSQAKSDADVIVFEDPTALSTSASSEL